MVKDIHFYALYSEAFFKPCSCLLIYYGSSQHPIFKIQYAPFIMQEKTFNIRAELYTKIICFYILIFTFKISEGASQSHSQILANMTIIASYRSVLRLSSCGLLMPIKNQRVNCHIFVFVNFCESLHCERITI